MDRAEAARVLGVAPSAAPDEARRAFRSLIRAGHPDRAGEAATAAAARLIEAHRALRAPPGPPRRGAGATGPRPDEPATATAAGPVDARSEGDALLVRADPATVMARLVEAGHALGEITYLDRSSGFVEVLLLVREEDEGHPAAVSLVASLQGRADVVEVFCTVERLDGHRPPPIAPVVAAVAAEMRRPGEPAPGA